MRNDKKNHLKQIKRFNLDFFNRKLILLITLIVVFSGCENDIKKFSSINNLEDKPIQWLKNAELIYSDSAKIQMLLKSPLITRYGGNNPYNEFPKGIKTFFYDERGKVQSHLTAKYAIHYIKEKRMEAKNDVVIVNEENNEQLNTEHLVWDEKKEMIYSNKFVKITTKDEILYGEGFESDQNFNKWKIKKPKGSFPVKIKN